LNLNKLSQPFVVALRFPADLDEVAIETDSGLLGLMA
jgi:hypothetical protein